MESWWKVLRNISFWRNKQTFSELCGNLMNSMKRQGLCDDELPGFHHFNMLLEKSEITKNEGRSKMRWKPVSSVDVTGSGVKNNVVKNNIA